MAGFAWLRKLWHKTHNQGVFDVYTDEIKSARHNKIITGLPDAYGRGRIVADFPRVALYGIDRLIAAKKEDFKNYGDGEMTDDVIRVREEISDQIRALKDMKTMAAEYGYDISYPATTAKEAVQPSSSKTGLPCQSDALTRSLTFTLNVTLNVAF